VGTLVSTAKTAEPTKMAGPHRLLDGAIRLTRHTYRHAKICPQSTLWTLLARKQHVTMRPCATITVSTCDTNKHLIRNAPTVAQQSGNWNWESSAPVGGASSARVSAGNASWNTAHHAHDRQETLVRRTTRSGTFQARFTVNFTVNLPTCQVADTKSQLTDNNEVKSPNSQVDVWPTNSD